MKNIGLQTLVFDLFFLNWPDEVVSEELSSNIYSLFDEFSEAIHSVSTPFTLIVAAFAPFINP
jgi:hypothetical protein